MRAYSNDLRERVVATVGEGMTKTETARIFRIGLMTVKRWMTSFAATGSLDPKPIPGRSPKIKKEELTVLVEQFQAHSDALLDEHCRMWFEKTGVLVSRATMSRKLARLELTIKKKRKQLPKEMK